MRDTHKVWMPAAELAELRMRARGTTDSGSPDGARLARRGLSGKIAWVDRATVAALRARVGR